MLTNLRKLWVTSFMHWGEMVQYRVDFTLWTLAEVMTPLLSLAVWYIVSLKPTGGPNPEEVLAYYITFIFTSNLVSIWISYQLAGLILKGDIVKFLIRPFPVIWQQIANLVVEKVIRIPTLLIVLALMFFFFPAARAAVMNNIEHPWLYVLSVLLSIAMSIGLKSSLGFMAFWLEEAGEIIRYQFLFETVASGMLIPYAFMPEKVVSILSILPFRYIYSAPVEILIGQADPARIQSLLLIQVVWTVVMAIMATVLWKKGLKRYAVPGQ